MSECEDFDDHRFAWHMWNSCPPLSSAVFGVYSSIMLRQKRKWVLQTYTGGGAVLAGTAGTGFLAGGPGASFRVGTAGGALLVGTAGGAVLAGTAGEVLSLRLGLHWGR